MIKRIVYNILEIPFIYNLSQSILAPGYKGEFTQALNTELKPFKNKKVIELGSGTGYYSFTSCTDFTATDINEDYLKKIEICNKILCSADNISDYVANNSYNLVYSVGLYHHLNDEQFHKSIESSIKVLKNGGYFIFIDNIKPTNRFNMIARVLRKYDRGRYVRSLENITKIINCHFVESKYSTGFYSYFNLEFVIYKCIVNKLIK